MAFLEIVKVFWRLDCEDKPDFQAIPIRRAFAAYMLEHHAAAHEHFGCYVTDEHAFGSICPSRVDTIQSLAENAAVQVGCKAIPVGYRDVYPNAERQ